MNYNIPSEAHPNKNKIGENGLDIRQPLVIQYTTANPLLSAQVSHLHVEFSDCHLGGNIYFDIDQNTARIKKLTIVFRDCLIYGSDRSRINRIELLEGCQVEIFFFDCILRNITIEHVQLSNLSVFNSIITSNYFSVQNSTIEHIEFTNVLGKFGINRCYNTDININYRDDNLYLPSKQILDTFRILFPKPINIFSHLTNILISDFKSLHIEFIKQDGPSGFNRSSINQNKLPRYHLSHEQVQSLNISFNIQPDTTNTQKITILNGELNSLDLIKDSNADIEISKTKINRLYLRNLSFKSLMLYDVKSRVKKGSQFEAKNIDFSNSTFDKVDLQSYALVSLYRSTLTGITFLSPKFPDEIHVLENVHYPDGREGDYYKMQSEVYRQIKRSLVSSGNQTDALEIHAKMYKSLEKVRTMIFQDKFILWLNRVSNSHGTSIILPVIWLVGSLLILFTIYRCSLDEAPYKWGWTSCESWFKAIGDTLIFAFDDFRSMWILINPTHKLSSLEELNKDDVLGSGSLFISYFSRIIFAWIIY